MKVDGKACHAAFSFLFVAPFYDLPCFLFHIIALCALVIELVREFRIEYLNIFFKIFSNEIPNSKTST